MSDLLLSEFDLYRDENFIFHGEDEETGRQIVGYYNRQKVNKNEPDLRLYYDNDKANGALEFLALWLKVSETGRKYLIGNRDGFCFVGFINSNRLDESEPYISICRVIKEQRSDFKNG